MLGSQNIHFSFIIPPYVAAAIVRVPVVLSYVPVSPDEASNTTDFILASRISTLHVLLDYNL
jgi:hypothetical protein